MPTFDAVLTTEGSGHLVELPFDPKAEFGRIRAPVRVSVNGVLLRTTVARYHGRDYIGLSRAFRADAGIEPGDAITLSVELDTEPRTVTPPPELAEALDADPEAADAFRALAYTHQRQYADWVGSAKKPTTRTRRARRAADMLRAGVRQP